VAAWADIIRTGNRAARQGFQSGLRQSELGTGPHRRLRSILDVIAKATVIATAMGLPMPARVMRVSMVRFWEGFPPGANPAGGEVEVVVGGGL
jgi:hypothetical protein